MPNSMPELLRLSRLTIDGLGQMNKQLLQALHTDQVLADRVQRLMTIPGVGQVLSLTWALEMGDITRFRSVKDGISYCGCAEPSRAQGAKDSGAQFLNSATNTCKLPSLRRPRWQLVGTLHSPSFTNARNRKQIVTAAP